MLALFPGILRLMARVHRFVRDLYLICTGFVRDSEMVVRTNV